MIVLRALISSGCFGLNVNGPFCFVCMFSGKIICITKCMQDWKKSRQTHNWK
jgi:hypothetical protein